MVRTESAVRAALARDGAVLADTAAEDDPRLRPEYLWMRARRPALAPLVVLVCDRADRLAGVVYALEECARGVRAGLLRLGDRCGDGLLIARSGRAGDVLRVAIRSLARLRRVHGFVINVPPADRDATEAAASLPGVSLRWGTYASTSRIVLPSTLDAFISQFGYRTRRNLRKAPARATRAGIRYLNGLDAPTFQSAFNALKRSCDRWNGVDPNLALAAAPQAIRAGLLSPNDEWLSVVAGWRHGTRAFVAAQLNHAGFREVSLSAVLRIRLIERLIADGARELVFLGGCAGTLRPACVPDPVVRALVEFHTPGGRLAKRVAQHISPRLTKRLWPPDLELADAPADEQD